MLSQNYLTTLLVLILLPIIVLNLTAAPTTTPNNLYSSAGTVTFTTSPYYNTPNNITNPAAITVTFSPRVQSNTNYQFGYSIQDIDYEIVNNQLNYSLQVGTKSTTNAIINFYTNNANKISSLAVSYIIIEPLFGSYYFSFMWLRPQLNFYKAVSPYIETSTSEGPFNMGSTFTVWTTIVGVDASLSANNQIDLYPSTTVTASTSIQYKIQTISLTAFVLNSIIIQAFIYDSTQLQSLNRNALITVDTFGSTSISSLSTTDASNSVRSYNTLVGIVGFHITSLSFLQFTTSITADSTMAFTSSYTFDYINFNYMIATFAYCASSSPYLLVSSKTCYDVCPAGYSTDTVYSECNYIACGNSFTQINQGCDDGNSISGDGCSSGCQIQTGFSCNTASRPSVCSFSSISIVLQSIIKDQSSNSLLINYNLSPHTHSALQSLNWPSITSQLSALNLSLTQFTFDPTSGNLQINVEYKNNVENSQMVLQLRFPNNAPFDLLGNVLTTTTLSSTNNLSLQLYEQQDYKAGYVLKYITLTLAIISLLFYLLGYYSGKLICIQLISVYQLTYFSLLSTEQMSPGLVALKQLSYSAGFNINTSSSSLTDRHFYYLNYNLNFVNCYNLTSIVVLLPVLISLVVFLINKLKYSSANQKLTKVGNLLKGEVTYYGIIFSYYPVFIALFAIMRQMSEIKADQIALLTVGCIFAILFIVYGLLLYKFAELFGQFTQQIQPIPSKKGRLYMFIQIQRIVIAVILTDIFIKYQLLLIMTILGIELTLVVIKKPYKQSGGNLRPILNLSILLLILLFVLLSSVLSEKDKKASLYMPYAVIILLFVTLAYNLYFYVKELRRTKCGDKNQHNVLQNKEMQVLLSSERAKINDLNPNYLNQQNLSTTLDANNFVRRPQMQVTKPNDKSWLTLTQKLAKIKEESIYPKHSNPVKMTNIEMVQSKYGYTVEI